jgi:hypothetical protein
VDYWSTMKQEARRRAQNAKKLFKRDKLHRCPACGSKLCAAWPRTKEFPNEEFAYKCNAIVIRKPSGKLEQDAEGVCSRALARALGKMN